MPKKIKRPSRAEFIDYDYRDKLTPEEADWLTKFTSEYYHNIFNGNRDVPDSRDLHYDREMKRKCYRKENERNRDVWNKFLRMNIPIDTINDEEEE